MVEVYREDLALSFLVKKKKKKKNKKQTKKTKKKKKEEETKTTMTLPMDQMPCTSSPYRSREQWNITLETIREDRTWSTIPPNYMPICRQDAFRAHVWEHHQRPPQFDLEAAVRLEPDVVPLYRRPTWVPHSAVSDKMVSKKGNKVWRCWARATNPFRKFERPTRSVVAQNW
ncbi:hypothetical protein LTR51_005791 [Lithohypha guttulata]|nr:hypothetical protein LTR51_005791 [Lithohypha guttulata]